MVEQRATRRVRRHLLCKGECVKFAFIDAEKALWPVEVQCELLGVSRSGALPQACAGGTGASGSGGECRAAESTAGTANVMPTSNERATATGTLRASTLNG
jgi:hypothetical protein